MLKHQIKNSKKSGYTLFFILSLVLAFSLIISFINPKFVHQNSFNETYIREDIVNPELSTPLLITSFIKRVNENIPQTAYRDFQMDKINESQLQEIMEASGRAKDELSSNEVYLSLQFTSRVLAYQKLYPFINCAEEIEKTGSKYKPLFYYLSYSDKERINKIQSVSDNSKNFIGYIEHYVEENQTIVNRAKSAYEIDDQLRLGNLKCEEFLVYLKEDYSRQKNWFYFRLTALIIIILIFYFIGKKIGRHDKNKLDEKSEKIIQKIKLAFSPEEIKEETIKSIISINSVASTLVAFIAVAINISALNNWLVVGLIILSVISLLSSLLLGVIAVNTKDSTYKKWCYRMFIIGILLFVGFFFVFIFSGSAGSILNGAKESLQMYLNNQTIK